MLIDSHLNPEPQSSSPAESDRKKSRYLASEVTVVLCEKAISTIEKGNKKYIMACLCTSVVLMNWVRRCNSAKKRGLF